MRSGDINVDVSRDDGTHFVEYQVVHDGDSPGSVKSSCYLESEEGKNFAVNIAQAGGFSSNHTAEIVLDGRLIASYGLYQGRDKRHVSKMRYEADDKIMEGKLAFAVLNTTDDHNAVNIESHHLQSLGTIKVELYTAQVITPNSQGMATSRSRYIPGSTVGVVHERSKKLGGCVGVTAAKEVNPSGLGGRRTLKRVGDLPFLTFTSNYRTQPVLQLMGIISAPTQQQPSVVRLRQKRLSKNASDVRVVELDDDVDGDEDEDKDTVKYKAKLKRKIASLEDDKVDLDVKKPKVGGAACPIDFTAESNGDD